MPSTSKPNPEKPTDLGQAAQEAQEKIREPINSETRFSTDPDKNMGMLAKTAYPNDIENQERYAAKIKASLEAHLKEGESIHALWEYLAKEFCQTTAIIEGILRFFAGEKGEKEINIGKYLKSMEFEATSSIEKTKSAQHEKLVAQTRTELSALLAEIRGSQA